MTCNTQPSSIMTRPLNVINLGVSGFTDPLAAAQVPVENCAWQPPAEGDAELGWKLAELLNDPEVDAANEIALSRFLEANPVLIGVGTAGKTIPGFEGRMLLHAGPPVSWKNMCGTQKGAVVGAIIYEGWAQTPEEARIMVEEGKVSLSPCHHYNSVAPMAGLISPSMPVWIVENTTHGNRTYCNFSEGTGKVLRFGAYTEETLNRLRFMADILAPVIASGIANFPEPLELKTIMAMALQMGDEIHNRNLAATNLFFRQLAPAVVRGMDKAPAGSPAAKPETVAAALGFISATDHFFLNLTMPACKAMADAAAGVPKSSMVTTMARNGVEFGIRISGLPGQWFTAPSPYVDGLYFPGFGPEDAGRDLGDSAITETAGVGGFAMASAPATIQFVGGTVADALRNSRLMRRICLTTNPAFSLPALDFAGTATGIDCRMVVDTGILPAINTGIPHKEASIGQIGAGRTHAPLACFTKAVTALYDTVRS